MTLRTGHGKGAGRPRIEVLPADELPKPVPAVSTDDERRVERRADGRFASKEAAAALGRLGGLAKARRVRLIDSLGLAKLAEDCAFGPYRTSAEEFTAHHLTALAKVAGGEVGPGPSTMVASAALQLAASRFAFDKFAQAGDASWAKLGSTLANDSRQNLLAAYELATREAQSKPRGRVNPLAAFMNEEPKR